jgi:Helicase HerA, central domain
MDSGPEDRIKVGTVEASRADEIQWLVTEPNAWAGRIGGEYHTVELPDGRLALLRLLTSESDERGHHCRSLYLGLLQPNEPRLPGIELPARQGTPVLTATKSAIRTAFWQYPEDALQIACLTGTGDRLREWLYLRLSGMNNHLGIFAASGSGKSYAVGRLIEELLIKVNTSKSTKTRRIRVVILDPNGDFSAFSKTKKSLEILLDLERVFKDTPGFIPDYSWENWIERRIKNLKQRSILRPIRDNFKKGFSDIFEGKVIWYIVDLQTEGSVSRAAEVLENISSHIFSMENPDDRKDLTFIVIDEAHNLVPRTLLPEDGNTRRKTQAIVNKLAAEGRKYGAFLTVISQSPSKIHPDTLSQCANLMVMRLTRQEDIKAIKDLRTDVPSELIDRIAGFRQGEALFIGDYVPAPTTARIVGRISKEGGSGPKV